MSRRRLLKMPPTEIGHAPRRGLIRIVGTVAGGGFRTPVLGLSCAAYVTELWEYDPSPTLLLRLSSDGPLLIDDPTGRAQVARAGRELVLSGTTHRGHYDEAKGSIERLLDDHDISPRNTTGSVRGLSFIEHVLRPGDEVTAVGFARQVVTREARGGASPGYRDVLTQLELGALPGDAVLVSDAPQRTGAGYAR